MAAVPKTPSAPPVLSTQAEALVTAFGARIDVNADQLTNFRAAVNASPSTIQQLNSAVASGQLTEIRPLPLGTNVGGQYDPGAKAMEVPLQIMTTPSGGRFNPAELTYVLGHEVQHAINQPGLVASRTDFVDEMKRISAAGNAVNDYTAPTAAVLAANRRDESTAQVGGWNATVDMVRATNPTPSTEDIYRANPGRMQRYIDITPGTPDTYATKPGVTLNADMSMSPTAPNVEAMGKAFFDNPASVSRLGHHANSNYTNVYALDAINYIAWHEQNFARPLSNGSMPQVQLNMAQLGFNESIIEQNGLTLGGPGHRLPYLDSSTQPPTVAAFDHTLSTHQHVPMPPTPVPSAPVVPGPTTPTSDTSTLPSSTSLPTPDNLHPSIHRAMDALDRSPNISAEDFGQKRTEVAAGIALHAADQKLTLDHVVLNDARTGLVAVQGPLGDPAGRLSSPLPVADALATNMSAAQRTLDTLQPVAAQSEALTRSLSAQQENPVREAVTPSR